MEIEAWYTCSFCFERNEVLVDVSGGNYQEYIEDCQVCCRPNRLRITLQSDLRKADIQSEEP